MGKEEDENEDEDEEEEEEEKEEEELGDCLGGGRLGRAEDEGEGRNKGERGMTEAPFSSSSLRLLPPSSLPLSFRVSSSSPSLSSFSSSPSSSPQS